jgi:hypothetical protein
MASFLKFEKAEEQKNFSNINKKIFNQENNPKKHLLLTRETQYINDIKKNSKINFELTDFSNNNNNRAI